MEARRTDTNPIDAQTFGRALAHGDVPGAAGQRHTSRRGPAGKAACPLRGLRGAGRQLRKKQFFPAPSRPPALPYPGGLCAAGLPLSYDDAARGSVPPRHVSSSQDAGAPKRRSPRCRGALGVRARRVAHGDEDTQKIPGEAIDP